jgi:polyisoprenoid-binding protein YceI
MKKTFLMLFLGLGLITLSACTANKQPAAQDLMLESDSNLVTESQVNDAPLLETEAQVNESSFADGLYEVDTAASSLAWESAKLAIVEHTGLVDIKSGSLVVQDGVLSGGEFVLDMNSISSDEGLDGLVNHLKSDDFFDVANHPEARLVITSVMTVADNYLVEADLTIKDITAPISFSADLSQEVDTMMAKAEFVIDRTVWDIRFGSGSFFDDLGDSAIKDEIIFNVSLVARP